MAGERDLEIRLMLQDKEALSRLHTALKQVESESKKTTDTMNRGWADIAGAYYLARQAIDPVIGFMREAVRAASEQEDAVNRLNVALRSQGIYSSALSESLQAMSGELQSSTRYSDEAILKIQQRLISLGNIAPEQIGRVTKAILDFSTATGKDVESSSMAFIQAANGKATALSKYGLVIDASIPKHQKLEEAIRLVEQRFGGAAQSDINTYAGAVANLGNAWDDFMETIGDLIIKSPQVVEGIHLTKSAVESLTSFLKDHKADVSDFFGSFTASGAPGAFATIGQSIMESIKGMGAAMGGLIGAGGSVFSEGPSLVEQFVGTTEQAQTAQAQMQAVADTAIQQKLSLEEQLAAIHTQFNEQAFQEDLLTNERKIEAQRQQLLAWYDEQSSAQMVRQQQENEMLTFALETQKQAHASLWSVAGKARDTFASGMSTMLVNLMKGTGNLKEAFADLGWQMVKILVDYLAQLAVSWAISKAMQALGLATTLPIADGFASAWAPAAALASLASFGGNAAPASAGILATYATAQGVALAANIPMAAEGGSVTSGGSVLVGENGPEFLNLPRGASVIPLGSPSSPTINIVININNPTGKIDDTLMSEIETRVSQFISTELERL